MKEGRGMIEEEKSFRGGNVGRERRIEERERLEIFICM